MIGLMGGTFSPIHYGHLLICENIREKFGLEKIIFMPAKSPPHKDIRSVIDAHHRYEMVRLAIENNPFFEVSDLEMKREGASYTIDTIRALTEKYNIHEKLALIVGADSLVQMETWRNYGEILKSARLIVSSRPDTEDDLLNSYINKFTCEFGAEIYKLSEQSFDFSSSDIRERIKTGLSIRYRVPEKVEEYIIKEGLYR